MSLRVVPHPGVSGKEEIVAFLNELRAKAEAGEIRGLGVAWVDSEGCAVAGYAWGVNNNRGTLIGASAVLTSRLIEEAEEAARS